MTRAIQQSVEFSVSPKELFELYMDSKKHSAATGGPAKISRKAGGKFTAFGGMLRGKNLVIIPRRMIVQSWRATHWKAADPDSILVLTFSKSRRGGRIHLVHASVPEYDHRGVSRGWRKYYWNPWKAYLAQRQEKHEAARR